MMAPLVTHGLEASRVPTFEHIAKGKKGKPNANTEAKRKVGI